MPRKRSIKLRCPICKKLVQNTGADFPFCGERCRLIDLSKWASAAYVIPMAEPNNAGAPSEGAAPQDDGDTD